MDQDRLLTSKKIFCVPRKLHAEKHGVFEQQDHNTYNPSILCHSLENNTNKTLVGVCYVHEERET